MYEIIEAGRRQPTAVRALKKTAMSIAKTASRRQPSKTFVVVKVDDAGRYTDEQVGHFKGGQRVAENPDPLTVGLILVGLVGAAAVGYVLVNSKNATTSSGGMQSSGSTTTPGTTINNTTTTPGTTNNPNNTGNNNGGGSGNGDGGDGGEGNDDPGEDPDPTE